MCHLLAQAYCTGKSNRSKCILEETEDSESENCPLQVFGRFWKAMNRHLSRTLAELATIEKNEPIVEFTYSRYLQVVGLIPHYLAEDSDFRCVAVL